eukprot:TRINITY_DN1990_c0_g1_i1.p2 TRINITY_DN1990_c0_g1~~TRINITY_DN1990_c0_g1_i1.p2  ORF type:complete len:106 (+),score=26.87 TRINITY_DN1990_c0_g1_i1:497-814(+)
MFSATGRDESDMLEDKRDEPEPQAQQDTPADPPIFKRIQTKYYGDYLEDGRQNQLTIRMVNKPEKEQREEDQRFRIAETVWLLEEVEWRGNIIKKEKVPTAWPLV